MELRSGRVVNGTIVLDDIDDLAEGARVSVWVGDPHEAVEVSGPELNLIRDGQAAVRRGELLDARQFMQALRQEG